MQTTHSNSLFSWEKFMKVPVIGIVRNISPEDLRQVLPLYLGAGMTTVEITMNSPGAEEMIRFSINAYGSDLNIGAGTVCDRTDLVTALAAGAQFIVTPIVDEGVITTCVKEQVPVFAGAFTPTEISRAWKLGADVVKVFPAGLLGPAYIRELKGPLDKIQFLPTGGVDMDNCVDYMKAGAAGVGMGGHLFDRELIRRRDWIALKRQFESLAEKMQVLKL